MSSYVLTRINLTIIPQPSEQSNTIPTPQKKTRYTSLNIHFQYCLFFWVLRVLYPFQNLDNLTLQSSFPSTDIHKKKKKETHKPTNQYIWRKPYSKPKIRLLYCTNRSYYLSTFFSSSMNVCIHRGEIVSHRTQTHTVCRVHIVWRYAKIEKKFFQEQEEQKYIFFILFDCFTSYNLTCFEEGFSLFLLLLL